MTSPRRRARPSTPVTLLVTVLLAVTTLAGCGSDEENAADEVRDALADAGAGELAEDIEAGDIQAGDIEIDPEDLPDAEDLENADDLGDITGDIAPGMDLIGSALTSALGGVDYTVDGSAVTIEMDEPDAAGVDCAVASTVLGSFDVPEDATITFDYPDGSVTCEDL